MSHRWQSILNFSQFLAVPDRNTEEWARWRIRQAYQKLGECVSPESFILPSYVNVNMAEESSEERFECHEKVKKRRRLKFVDDRAAVAEPDESSSIETDSDEIYHPSISLTSSSDEY